MNYTVYVGNICATIFLSGIFIVAANHVETIGAITLATQRFSVASVIFAALMVLGLVKFKRVPLNRFPLLILAAFLGVFAYNVFFFKGIEYSGPVHGGVIIGFTPIITMVMQSLAFREHMTLITYLGAAISLTGVLFFFFTQHNVSLLSSFQMNSVLQGDLLFLGAACTWAGYTLTMKRLSASIPPLTATALSVMLGSVMLAMIDPNAPNGIPFDELSYSFPIIYLALFGTVGAFTLWFHSVEKIGPARTNIFLNFVPIFTSLMSWYFLGADVSSEVVVALVLVLSGVIIVQTANFNWMPGRQTVGTIPKP